MVAVNKVYLSDFDKIYPLLLEFKNPYITKAAWRELFVQNWPSDYDHFGYMLTDLQDKAVGFLGTVFSTRVIRNRTYKFCNLTSWIILPAFKAKGIALLFEALKLKNCIITNLSPTHAVAELLKMARLREIDSSFRVLLPFPACRSGKDGHLSVVFDKAAVERKLSPAELPIMHDHDKFKCIHALIQRGNEHCYCILTRVMRRGFPFASVNYASNLKLFRECIDLLRCTLCVRLKTAGICVDERFLKGAGKAWSFTKVQSKFVSQCDLDDEDIDNLYSEFIILNN